MHRHPAGTSPSGGLAVVYSGWHADVVQPPDFSDVHWDDWAPWVLEHGLPELPGRIGLEELVPVSFWRGERYGAVLFVHRFVDTRPEDLEPDEEWDEDELVDLDAELFRRVGGTWEGCGGGGQNWHTSGTALTRRVLDPHAVDLTSMYGSGNGDEGCVAVYGYVGEAVASLELVQQDTVERRPVCAPLAAAVVAVQATQPFTIRALAQDGSVVAEIAESADSLAAFWAGR